MLLFLKQLWHAIDDPNALVRLIELYREISPEILSVLFFKSRYKLREEETINRFIRVTLCSGKKLQGGLFSDSPPDFSKERHT